MIRRPIITVPDEVGTIPLIPDGLGTGKVTPKQRGRGQKAWFIARSNEKAGEPTAHLLSCPMSLAALRR
jgi:hypothetical protein